MFPVSDDNSGRTGIPYINYLLIILNILVFIVLQGGGHNVNFTYSFATIPAEIVSGYDIVTDPVWVKNAITGQIVEIPGLGITPKPVWVTLVTSMFMHGSFAHLFGNLLYLWVFGDNVENKIGHFRYLLFYIICGVLATLTYVFTDYFFGMDYLVPSLGASGAISGVMGAYLINFPRSRVTLFVFFFFVHVPAYLVLGSWILLQVAYGTGYLGGNEPVGIAYAAHIGGFVFGLSLASFLPSKPQKRVSNYYQRMRHAVK